MSEPCAICGLSVNPFDQGTWKEVAGWVGGPRKDVMTLRQDTGKHAHDHCVQKLREGQPADQPDLFGTDEAVSLPAVGADITPEVTKELFGGN